MERLSCVSQWAHPAGGPYSHAKKNSQSNFTVFFFIILFIACLFFSTIHFICIKVCVCAQFCYCDVSTVVCSLLVHLWTTLDTYFSLKLSNDTKTQASGISDHEAWFYMLMYDLSTHCSCWGMCPSALFVLSGQVNRQREKEKRKRQTVSDFSSTAFLKRSC